jgi:hypothetical protein
MAHDTHTSLDVAHQPRASLDTSHDTRTFIDEAYDTRTSGSNSVSFRHVGTWISSNINPGDISPHDSRSINFGDISIHDSRSEGLGDMFKAAENGIARALSRSELLLTVNDAVRLHEVLVTLRHWGADVQIDKGVLAEVENSTNGRHLIIPIGHFLREMNRTLSKILNPSYDQDGQWYVNEQFVVVRNMHSSYT